MILKFKLDFQAINVIFNKDSERNMYIYSIHIQLFFRLESKP